MDGPRYVVFVDGLNGMKEEPKLPLIGMTLEEVIQSVTEGVGFYRPSQQWMYYIYEIYDSRMTFYKTKFAVYRLAKSVAGSAHEGRPKAALQYAMTSCLWGVYGPDWVFTDNLNL